MQLAGVASQKRVSMEEDDPTVDLRVRTELDQVSAALSLLRVRNDAWPFEHFVAYVDALRDRCRIASDAELARQSGIASSVISRWRSGQMQPSRENLAKLAPVLGVKPVQLWVAAGLARPEEMDLSGEIDLRVLPGAVQHLADLYIDARMTADDRDLLSRHVEMLVSGVRADLDRRPNGEGKRARRGAA